MTHFLRLSAVAGLVLIGMSSPADAQLTPEQQADMILLSARKAFGEKNYVFAAARFREFADKYPANKEANAARFGQTLSQLALPEKDRNEAEIQANLTRLAGEKEFADRPAAAFRLALLIRNQGLRELPKPDAPPEEMAQRTAAAKAKFEQAAAAFAVALPLLQAEAKEPGDKELSEAWQSVARARCDLAEMQLRLGKLKEAQATADPFLNDPNLSRSRYVEFGRYLAAHATFLLGDIAAAQKALTMIAPYSSPDFGPHARYLLARTHHLSEERGDALAQYELAIADHQKHQANAALMLKEPQRFQNDPVKRDEYERTLKRPTPDHIARSQFYLGVLLYEAGQFAQAKTRFQDFAKAFPQSPMKVEADLRTGYCQVQLKEFAEALKTLQPLTDKEALGDQVFLWIGKAQLGLAPNPAANWTEYRAQAVNAINTLRGAYDRASRLTDTPDTRTRRGEILLEIADALHAIKEPKDAGSTYQAIISNKLLPDREEEISVRVAQAMHQAKEFTESDARCLAFFQKFPASTLTAPVAFTFAENAIFRAAALEKTPPSPDRNKQLAALYDDAFKRLQVVLEKHPEYPKIPLVRYSLGLTHYRKGDFEKAYKEWSVIPQTDRVGDLSLTPYLMADCVLRQTPATLAADADALAAGKIEEQLKTAVELLDAFVSGNPKDDNVPDALLKYGLCQQRRSSSFADAKDKQDVLANARSVYERIFKEFPKSDALPDAVFERAKVIARQGDIGTSINELRRFTKDPLVQARVAPMATINLATLLRAQNKSAEAADLLQKAREQFEQPLSQDPSRAAWVLLLRFHHGAALREANKLPEARAAFQAVFGPAPKSAEGVEAALRFGQAFKEEGQQRIALGRKMLGNPKDAPQARDVIADGYRIVGEASSYLESASDQLKTTEGFQEPRARMLYDAAWGWRLIAEPELKEAKNAVARDLSAKASPKGDKVFVFNVPIQKVPLQPAEKKCRAVYKKLIDLFGDAPVSVEARFELAELLADRDEFDPALAMLNEALDREPNVDLTEKIRLRLGSVQAAKGNAKAAATQFEAVLNNPKSQNLPWAQYRAAELLIQNKDYVAAIARLVHFRDNPQFQNVPDLTDRALLRLGQAYALTDKPGESAQAFQRVLSSFPNSPYVDDARFGLAWVLQKQGNLDEASSLYKQVVDRTASDLAAKALFQIGTIRMEQKRYPEAAFTFLTIPNTYGYAEYSGYALLKAGEAFREANNREQMVRAFERVINEYPNSDLAVEARERLTKKQ
jgi:TolA-binding protein